MLNRNIVGYNQYTTIQGDTFDGIALEAYNDEMMATEIMAANPDYCDVLIFDAGYALKIPIFDGKTSPETLPPWRRE